MKALIPLPYYSSKQRRTALAAAEVEIREVDQRDAPIVAVLMDDTPWGRALLEEYRFFDGRVWCRQMPEAGAALDPRRMTGSMVKGSFHISNAASTWMDCQSHPLVPAYAKALTFTRIEKVTSGEEGEPGFIKAMAAAEHLANRKILIDRDLWEESPGPIAVLRLSDVGRQTHVAWHSGRGLHGNTGLLTRMAAYHPNQMNLAREDARLLTEDEVPISGRAPKILTPQALGFDAETSAIDAAAWYIVACMQKECLPSTSRSALEALVEIRSLLSMQWPGRTFDFGRGNGRTVCPFEVDELTIPPAYGLASAVARFIEEAPLTTGLSARLLGLIRMRAERAPVAMAAIPDLDQEAFANLI